MASTLPAVNVTKDIRDICLLFSDARLAVFFRAVELFFWLVNGGMSREKVDGEHLICLTLFLADVLKSFKFNECFGAVLVALVEVAGECD